MKKIFLFGILLVLSSLICFAQEKKMTVKHSEIIEKIDGKDYYIHFTKEGQTIKSIANAYGITSENLVLANPEIKTGIHANQIIKIPVESSILPHQQSNVKQVETNDNNFDLDQKTDDYIFHIVKEKETIFSIEKKYNISEDELIKSNPELKNGLKFQSTIKIPLHQTKTAEKTLQVKQSNPTPQKLEVQETQKNSQGLIEYHVASKETLYGISKKFGIPIPELIRINPELKDGLKKDQIIKIPSNSPEKNLNDTIEHKKGIKHAVLDTFPEKNTLKEKKTTNTNVIATEVSQPSDCSTASKSNVYRVALLLPLYLKESDSIITDDITKIKPATAYKSMRFLQFYEGALIAVDSLKKMGLNVNFYVYDVDEDTLKTGLLLRKQEMQKMNLIIGPFYSRNFKKVSVFAKKYNIPIVNPLSTREEILENNPYVFKFQPSNKAGFNETVNFLKKNYSKHNILVIRYPRTNETSSYFNTLKSEIINQENGKNLNFKEVNNIDDIIKNLQSEPENIILALSENKAFVLNLLTKLNKKRNDCKITIFGMPAWTELDMDPLYTQNLNLHLFMPSFVDYHNNNTKNFIKTFRESYKIEPEESKYAFIGFDVTYYFLSALLQYGNDFKYCLQNIKMDPLSSKLQFKKTLNGGYDNQSVFIVRYKDFKMENVTDKIDDK